MQQDTPDVASVTEFTQHLKTLQNLAVTHLEKSRQVQARAVDTVRPKPAVFEVEDLVPLSTHYLKPAFIRQAGGSKKLLPKCIRSFQITRNVGITTCELDLPLDLKVHPVNNIGYLEGYKQNPEHFGPRDAPRSIGPDSVVIQASIEEIRGHRLSRDETQLLVYYAKAADHDDTWVDVLSIGNQGMVDGYMLRNKDDSTPKPPRQDRLAAQAMVRVHEAREREEHDRGNHARILTA